MTKQFIPLLALLMIFLGTAACPAAVAQQGPTTTSDGKKTKARAAGTMTKSKAGNDGKRKNKSKAGSSSTKYKVKAPAAAQAPPAAGVLVGGTLMTPDKNLVNNAVNSTDHTTLVSALAAGGLVETLKSAGPYTLFAPTNAAFDKLPAGAVTTLLMPENKQRLYTILAYHVVPGNLKASDLVDGQTLTTLQGATLTVVKKGPAVLLRDVKGGTATILIPNVISSNGITHVIDQVLQPAK